jgi:hypothetical protein
MSKLKVLRLVILLAQRLRKKVKSKEDYKGKLLYK